MCAQAYEEIPVNHLPEEQSPRREGAEHTHRSALSRREGRTVLCVHSGSRDRHPLCVEIGSRE